MYVYIYSFQEYRVIYKVFCVPNKCNKVRASRCSSKHLDSGEITVRYTIPRESRIVGHVARAVANDLTISWHAMGVDYSRRFEN